MDSSTGAKIKNTDSSHEQNEFGQITPDSQYSGEYPNYPENNDYLESLSNEEKFQTPQVNLILFPL